MKKLYMTFAALLIAATSFSQSPLRNAGIVQKGNIPEQLANMTEAQAGAMATNLQIPGFAASWTKTNKVRNLAIPTDTALIRKQPDGTLFENLYRISNGLMPFYGYVIEIPNEGYTCNVVEGKDGAVYLNKPFSTFSLFTGWIKGTRAEGDTIQFEFPQPVYCQNAKDLSGNPVDSMQYFYAWKMHYGQTTNAAGKVINTYLPDDVQTMKFVWRNDSLIKVDTALVGLATDKGEWTGYGDETIIASPNGDKPTEGPGQTAETVFSLEYKNLRAGGDGLDYIKGYVDDRNIYLKGFNENIPDAWVKGEIMGNKAVFRHQYVGLQKDARYHAYFVPAYVDSVYDDAYGKVIAKIEHETDSIVFDYDATKKSLKSDSAFVFNIGRHRPQSNNIAAYYQPSLLPFVDKAITPADPTFTDFMDYDPEYKFGGIAFNLSNRGPEGEILDVNKMYYNMYFDDNLVTFTPDKYVKLKEDMTNVPYTYNDGNDFMYSSGTEHTVYFYVEGLKKIGVQLFYIGGGKNNGSNIAWLDTKGGTGINNIESGTDVLNAHALIYRDLTGREVKNPGHGIYLKTVSMPDGSLKTYKVVIK